MSKCRCDTRDCIQKEVFGQDIHGQIQIEKKMFVIMRKPIRELSYREKAIRVTGEWR